MNVLITNQSEFLTKLKTWQEYTDLGLQTSHLIGYIQTEHSYYPIHIGKYYGILCSQLITTNGESATFWNSLNIPDYQIYFFNIPTPLNSESALC